MISSLRSMYSRLSHISALLSQDRSDPLGPSPNLLPIHYHLTQLETFRNETLAQARKGQSGASATETLEKYFERLGETIEAFEAHYFRLARELLELARRGHAAIGVKLAKIAEVEGARDQKALAIRMVKKSGNVDVAARFRSLQAEARVIKHYRAKVLDAIRDGCRTAIERSYARHGDNGVAWLEDLEWIFEDLVVVEKELVPRFPPDWKVSRVETLRANFPPLIRVLPSPDSSRLVSFGSISTRARLIATSLHTQHKRLSQSALRLS